MKKLFILVSLLSCVIVSHAQDKLITQKGDVKTVYNVEVGSNNIFYKLENKESAPIQQILKKDVLTIIHPDGSKELFNGENASDLKVEKTETASTTSSKQDMAESKVINDSLVAKYNGNLVTYINDDIKAKNKKALILYLLPQLKKGSIIGDSNLDLDIKADVDDNYNRICNLTLKNKTDKTIYIDLGNTFFIRGAESTPYYIPSATSSTNGQSGGVGVNLGSVAGALGVGGVAGTIANGVNVGGETSRSSTTTTYSQRVVAIPPLSTKKLESQLIFPLGSESLYSNLIRVKKIDKKTFYATIKFENKSDELKAGETKLFDESNSPINFGSYITYSFDENCANINHLNAKFYVREIIGYGYGTIYLKAHPDKELSTNYKCSPVAFYFQLRY